MPPLAPGLPDTFGVLRHSVNGRHDIYVHGVRPRVVFERPEDQLRLLGWRERLIVEGAQPIDFARPKSSCLMSNEPLQESGGCKKVIERVVTADVPLSKCLTRFPRWQRLRLQVVD